MMNTPNLQNPLMQSYFPAPQMEIQKVSGEESARSFPMGPNSSVILLDTLNPIIWVVVTDSSGYKTVSPFTITPYIPEQPVTAADLKDQIGMILNRLEKIEEKVNQNAQPNNGPAGENESSNARTQPNAWNGKGVSKSNGSNPANGSK